MMENQNNNLQELEELRSQVAEFKHRMEQQEIVSRRLLDTAMKGHVTWFRTYNTWSGPIALVLMPFFIAVWRHVGCSWAPPIYILIILIGETVFNLWNVSTIRDKHLAAHDVISVQQRLIAYKRREKLQVYTESPLILLWFVWLMYDIHNVTKIPLNRVIPFFIVTLILLLLVCFFLFSREMYSLNKAIKDIDDLTGKE